MLRLQKDHCLGGGCLNNGTCMRQSYWRYVCACTPEYEGVTCESEEMNECDSDPCPAGESCTDQISGYDCFPDTFLNTTCLNGGT